MVMMIAVLATTVVLVLLASIGLAAVVMLVRPLIAAAVRWARVTTPREPR
jgi:hypothetical protein